MGNTYKFGAIQGKILCRSCVEYFNSAYIVTYKERRICKNCRMVEIWNDKKKAREERYAGKIETMATPEEMKALGMKPVIQPTPKAIEILQLTPKKSAEKSAFIGEKRPKVGVNTKNAPKTAINADNSLKNLAKTSQKGKNIEIAGKTYQIKITPEGKRYYCTRDSKGRFVRIEVNNP